MFQFNRDFSEAFCAARDVSVARALNPGMQTFEQWLGKHAGQVPLG
jgi:hypothetical protein